MIAWWDALTALERVFALLAIPATLLLVLQTVLLLIGFDGDGDADGDGIPDSLEDGFDCDDLDCDDTNHDHSGPPEADDPGLRIFSVRTIVAFFTVFGWSGIVLTKAGIHELFAILLASLAGGLSMVLLAGLLRLVLGLQSSGNLDPRNAIGLVGTVYLTIPPERSGTGKVTLLLQGRYAELDATTDSSVPLATGTEVVVTDASYDALTVALTEQIQLGGTQ